MRDLACSTCARITLRLSPRKLPLGGAFSVRRHASVKRTPHSNLVTPISPGLWHRRQSPIKRVRMTQPDGSSSPMSDLNDEQDMHSYAVGWALLGGYLIVSLVLLKHPQLLHRRKKTKFTCVHISHRGGAYERLENTMGAFEHAVEECGTDMLELDVHLTLDKQVVVAHDASLLRTTGVDNVISELCYKDLPLLKTSLDVEFMDGQPCATMHDNVDRRIPLLREVFERFPTVAMNIDLKVNDDNLVEEVYKLIEKFDRKDITVWGNSSYVVTQKCYNRDPSIPIFFSAPRVVWLTLLAWTGLLPFVPIRESCLAILHTTAMIRNSEFKQFAADNPAYWCALKAVDVLLMRPFIVEHLRNRGVQVYFWVLNDREAFARGFELGASGVMTDCPSLLRTYLQENPHIVTVRANN